MNLATYAGTHPFRFPFWLLLTNPYCISAVACGLLAFALSYYRSRDRHPRLAPKPRRVFNSHVRIDSTSYLFQTTSATPHLLICTERQALYTLHQHKASTASALPSSISFKGVPYITHHLSHLSDLLVLEQGLHFHRGRAIKLSSQHKQHSFTFLTRNALNNFVHLLAHAKGDRPPESLRLFLTTFNVGNNQPPDDLSPWLNSAQSASLIAIGVQECSYSPSPSLSSSVLVSSIVQSNHQSDDSSTSTSDDISPSHITTESSETSPLLQPSPSQSNTKTSPPTAPQLARSQSTPSSGKDHWHTLLEAHFPEPQYVCIVKQSAWDRSLTIFVKKSLFKHVSNVRVDTANVGLGGVAGNKGAIGTRFKVYDTEFLIINSHLAAHHKEVNRRNEDFSSIAGGLHSLSDDSEVDILSDLIHHTFWMGDLNYRINLDREEVIKHIAARNWQQLRQADQLLLQMSAGRAFEGFSEGKIDFAPTYKYDSGSRQYSARKMRIPSYCDRILYRSLPGCTMRLTEYQAADEIMTSDHSPVYALFTASVTHSNSTRRVPEIAHEQTREEEADGYTAVLSPPRALQFYSPSNTSRKAKRIGLQLVFINLGVADIPEMDNGGHRVAVARALRIENHIIWKKHDELGEGRSADPYCTFHGSAVMELDEGEYRTETIAASQNPVWAEEQIPKVDLVGNDKQLLQTKYVIVTVKDENPNRRHSIVGCTILRLDGLNNEEPVQFSKPIMQGGLKQGLISGRYFVR